MHPGRKKGGTDIQSVVQYALALEERVTRVEENMAHLPQMIKEIVRDEAKRLSDAEQAVSLIDRTTVDFTEKVDSLEHNFVDSTKKTRNVYKKLQA
jgi:uncharacterized protein (UPF0335 family)